MNQATAAAGLSPRAQELFEEHREKIYCQTDRLFAGLMFVQFVAGVIAAFVISPRAWSGSTSQVHHHVWAALIIGGLIASLPIGLVWTLPGKFLTRCVTASAQMLFSALLIHLTGGRIETHFHVFGSLAFVAFYRDWRVLIPATAVVGLDHLLRGIYWPESVYGVLTASPWRSVEHAAWVGFEDFILVLSCLRGVAEIRQISEKRAELEATNASIESKVTQRTAELNQKTIALEQEIRERNQVEETLRETHVALTHAMPGISRLTVDGIYERVNDSYASYLGYFPEDLIGQPWQMTVHPGDHTKGQEAYERMMAHGTSEFEATAVRKDGSTFYKQVMMVKIADAKGKFLGHHCFMRDITEKVLAEKEKEVVQRQLVDLSRTSGMAEVATNVLHNVGNVLNSVNVSAVLVKEKVSASPASDLVQIATMLNSAPDPGAFITQDARGKLVPRFLEELSRHLVAEQGTILSELESLGSNLEHIKEIVAMQQAYSKFSGVKEELAIADLLNTSIRVNSAAFSRHSVKVVREFSGNPRILVEKHKLLQILVNLLTNAKHAVAGVAPEDRRLVVRAAVEGENSEWVKIEVEDNGMGIAPENLTRIFAHGFTTRKDGHGFGLHSSALAAKELGGTLTAQSKGVNNGATFTLRLPVRPVEVST